MSCTLATTIVAAHQEVYGHFDTHFFQHFDLQLLKLQYTVVEASTLAEAVKSTVPSYEVATNLRVSWVLQEVFDLSIGPLVFVLGVDLPNHQVFFHVCRINTHEVVVA